MVKAPFHDFVPLAADEPFALSLSQLRLGVGGGMGVEEKDVLVLVSPWGSPSEEKVKGGEGEELRVRTTWKSYFLLSLLLPLRRSLFL